MVVDQDQGRGVEFKRPADDFAWIDGDVIDRATGLFLVRDQDVLAIQVKDAELLDLAMGHGSVAIIQQRVPSRQDRAVHDPGPGHALCRGLDDLQFGHYSRPDALDLFQPCGGGRKHAVEIAEGLDQAAGEGFDILAGDGAEQDQFQHLVVRHGPCAARHEAFPQPRAVIGEI